MGLCPGPGSRRRRRRPFPRLGWGRSSPVCSQGMSPLPGASCPPSPRVWQQRSFAGTPFGQGLLQVLETGRRNSFLKVAAAGEVPGKKLPPGAPREDERSYNEKKWGKVITQSTTGSSNPSLIKGAGQGRGPQGTRVSVLLHSRGDELCSGEAAIQTGITNTAKKAQTVNEVSLNKIK